MLQEMVNMPVYHDKFINGSYVVVFTSVILKDSLRKIKKGAVKMLIYCNDR